METWFHFVCRHDPDVRPVPLNGMLSERSVAKESTAYNHAPGSVAHRLSCFARRPTATMLSRWDERQADDVTNLLPKWTDATAALPSADCRPACSKAACTRSLRSPTQARPFCFAKLEPFQARLDQISFSRCCREVYCDSLPTSKEGRDHATSLLVGFSKLSKPAARQEPQQGRFR